MRRVAFCGASGAGKTTLAEYLAKELGIPLNPVGSRSVATWMGFKSPYDVDQSSAHEYQEYIRTAKGAETKDDQLLRNNAAEHARQWYRDGDPTMRAAFQDKLLQKKITWELAHGDFVTDRTPVDNFVYSAIHDPKSMTEKYMRDAAKHLERYDIIFFTPISSFHDTAGDPKRVDERGYHAAYELFCDGTLVNWLGNDWNEKVVYVELGGLSDRLKFVKHRVETRRQFIGLEASRAKNTA